MNFLRVWAFSCLCLGSLAYAQSAATSPQQFADLGELKLESGASIHGCKLGYRTLGTLNAEKSNVVVYPTWFTGNSEDLLATVAETGFIDPAAYYFIFVDSLGDGVSCSPSNSATQPGVDFPEFTIRDMVESEHRMLTEKMGLTHVHAVMGMSMGGMQTFQWMVSYPQFMDVAIPIVGSPKVTSYDMLFLRTEEAALLAEPAYVGGRYKGNPKFPTVQLIKELNLTTPEFRVKRTKPEEFAKFFETTENAMTGAFDGNDLRWQIHAILSLDIGNGETVSAAAARVKARVFMVSSEKDHMVNPTPGIEILPMVRARMLMLHGDCGHIAPVCEADLVRPAIAEALKQSGER